MTFYCQQASLSVENALYADPRVLEAAAVGVPDKRLGELVAAVVSVKPAYIGKVPESSLIEGARKRLTQNIYVTVLFLIRSQSVASLLLRFQS